MSDGMLGLAAVMAVAALMFGLILQARVNRHVKVLLLIGLLLRLVGSQVYFYLSEAIYGFGDYDTYFGLGLYWAEAWVNGSSAEIQNAYLANLCCTGFTVRLTGLLLLLLGPTINGAFLAYALFGYLGIVAIAIAFARAHPGVPLERYLVWVVLFPSLWYWPAAIGKDALILGGIGLAVMGYIGRRGRTGWLSLGVGTLVVFAVRPQVAVVLVMAMLGAHWIGGEARWTPSRILQGVVLAAGGVGIAVLAGGALGLQLFNPQEVEAYLSTRSTASSYGGSAVQGGVLIGLVNVLFRPFPWDVGGVASAIAAVEVASLWALAFWNRQRIRDYFRAHRESRLLWFAVFFTAAYVFLTGIALGNLGLIARQRVLVFPFLLMFFAGGATHSGARRVRGARPRDIRCLPRAVEEGHHGAVALAPLD